MHRALFILLLLTASIMSTSTVPAPIQYWSKFLRDAMENNKAVAGMAMIDVMHIGGAAISKSFAAVHASLINDLAGTLTEDGIARFETALTDQVRQKLEHRHGVTYLSTDYDPCEAIMVALAAGGMVPERRYGFFFPMKTIMDIMDDGKDGWSYSIRK